MIKYRAYYPKLGMCVVNAIDFDQQTVQIQRGESFATVDFSEITLLQFTGLQDKSGKDIYEGDIVELGFSTTDVEWEGLKAQVIYWTNGFYFEELRTKQLAQDIYYQVKFCKVIGNAFENPELLNKSVPRGVGCATVSQSS